MTTVALIIPVHNEEACIDALLGEMSTVCAKLVNKFSIQFRAVFVDDGSSDNTCARIEQSKLPNIPITLIRFSRNFGKESALTAGLSEAAEDDAVIIMDADLQHPLEMIETFIERWQQEQVDVVYAYKESRRSEGIFMRIFSTIFYRLLNYSNRYEIPKNAGDFRLISQPVVRAILSMPENERFMKGLYSWVGFQQLGLAYTPNQRKFGKTTFSKSALIALSIDGLTSFSIAPLRLMSIVGFLISLLSAFYFAYVVFERLFLTTAIPGLASVFALVSLFGGVQLICLGIIGEYVGKILMESKRRPTYVISKVQRFGNDVD